MSGFGRKCAGMGTGQSMPMPRAGAAAIDPQAEQLAAKREAFLAAERARRAQEPPEAGISDFVLSKGVTPTGERSIWLAYLWWFILGQISLHRFYLGATQSAKIQVGMFVLSLLLLFTGNMMIAAVFFIPWCLWILGDAFLIPGLHRRYCERHVDVARVFS